jgi:hypothetical protein
MPKRRTKKKCGCRRGGSIGKWIGSAHKKLRSVNAYSRGLSAGYNKYGHNLVKKHSGRYAPIIDRGVALGLAKLKQAGYGLKLAGAGRHGGLRRMKY